MKRSRRRFGPLFYMTTAIALLLLISRPFWQAGGEQWMAWRLARQLRDPAEPVRREAADGLVQLGPAATSWVIRAMRDNDARVRRLACSILVRTTPARPEEALAALLAAAKDSDPSVRDSAVGQLELIITRHRSSPGSNVRERALRALCDLLGDNVWEVRMNAGYAFSSLGPTARSVVSELDRTLDGPDKRMRVIVAEALLRVDPEATRARVIAAMSSMLAHGPKRFERYQLFERYRLVEVLKSAQGEEPTAAIIIPLLKHPDREMRMQAIYELTTQCPSAKALRPVLIEALASDDGAMRDEAALFFLKHEPAMAPRAIDTLAEQIVDPLVGSYLLWDLVKQTREVSPRSIKLLASKLNEYLARATTPTRRVNAIMALGEIGADAVVAVPALLKFSDSDDLNVATRAVESLARIDPHAAETKLPLLLEWMTAKYDSAIRRTAIASLRDLGPAAALAIPALLKLADEKDLTISAGAIEAISRIDPDKGQALKQAIARGELGSQDE